MKTNILNPIFLFLLVPIVFGGVNLYMSLAKLLEPINRYVPTEATITSNEVRSDGGKSGSHTLTIRYDYRDKNGAKHYGHYRKMAMFTSLKSTMERTRQYEAGASATVYYDPKHPNRSRLFLERDWETIILLGGLGLFMLTMVGVFIKQEIST